jgi:Tol biopolymer transport system component
VYASIVGGFIVFGVAHRVVARSLGGGAQTPRSPGNVTLTPLTTTPPEGTDLSADGETIAYVSDRNGNSKSTSSDFRYKHQHHQQQMTYNPPSAGQADRFV